MERAYGDGARHRAGLFEAIRAYWAVVVVATLVAVSSGYFMSSTRPDRYKATARLLLAAPDEASVFRGRAGSGSPERRLANEVEQVESVDVATRAATTLGGVLTPAAVSERIKAQAQPERDVIIITGTGVSGKEAADVTNAVAEAYRDLRRERAQLHATQATASLDQYAKELSDTIAVGDARLQEIRARIDAEVRHLPTPEERLDAVVTRMQADLEGQRLQDERNTAQDELIQLRTEAKQIATDAALNDAGVNLYERADQPRAPASPKPKRDAALAGVLGVVAAAAWVWTRAERMQQQVDGRDAAAALGAPLLAEIPVLASAGLEVVRPRSRKHRPSGSDPFRLAMASLQFAQTQNGAKSVMVTSPSTGGGSTLIAFNLAAAALREGRRVLLVDADLHGHHLTTQLGLDAVLGLGELVADVDGRLPGAAYTTNAVLDDGRSLSVIPAGSLVNRAIIDGEGLERALRDLEAVADLVVIDAPPVLTVGEVSSIAAAASGIVVVVDRDTNVRTLEETRWRLELTGTPVLGCIVNHAPARDATLRHRWSPRRLISRSAETAPAARTPVARAAARSSRSAPSGPPAPARPYARGEVEPGPADVPTPFSPTAPDAAAFGKGRVPNERAVHAEPTATRVAAARAAAATPSPVRPPHPAAAGGAHARSGPIGQQIADGGQWRPRAEVLAPEPGVRSVGTDGDHSAQR